LQHIANVARLSAVEMTAEFHKWVGKKGNREEVMEQKHFFDCYQLCFGYISSSSMISIQMDLDHD